MAHRGNASIAVLKLLGPVRLELDGREVDLGPAKQQCLLAVLAMSPGQPVSAETLVDQIWGGTPPQRARGTLATYAARLRRILEAAGCPLELLRIRFALGGYIAQCAPDLVDLHRARGLVSEARLVDTDAAAADHYDRALAGWQPVALAGLSGAWAERIRAGLHDEYLDVLARWAGARLRLGTDDAVIDRLQPLFAQYPTAETLAAPLMTALLRTNRIAQLQNCYRLLSRALADELGAEPSPRVQELHLQSLRPRSPGPVAPVVAGVAAGRGEGEGRRDDLELLILGPVDVRVDGATVPLRRRQERCLLAVLAMEPGRFIPMSRLAEVLWGDEPPTGARSAIQAMISHLRAVLGGTARLVNHGGGYALDIDPDRVDLHRFRALIEQGRASSSAEERAALLAEALGLWRGVPLAGALGDAQRERLCADLTALHLTAREEWVDARMELGFEVVEPLTRMIDEHPLDERLRAQLMLALYRSGRRADALEAYQRARDVLVREVGLEPGPELQALHRDVLTDAPTLPHHAQRSAEVTSDRTAEPPPGDGVLDPTATEPPRHLPRPAQLPPDPTDFTGRDHIVRQLVELFDGAHSGTAVSVVAGPAGVGKSALTVHVAHQVKTAYPDGQLHIDLRGSGAAPASPAEVLGRFLRALQVDPSAIPDSVEERTDAYRTQMADRRMLVVLDDAVNEQQVRPLLPGSATCGVLVASRSRLPGLAAAQWVGLEMLSQDEAITLLGRIAGPERIAASPDAAARIVQSCGRLPLAVRIAGARLASRRHWSPALLADRLDNEQRRLDELQVGDQQVRASIEMSYRALDPTAQTAFRRLGRLGLSDFRCWVVAALLDVDPATAEGVVEQLVDAHLVDYSFVDQTGQVRYRVHDLIRIYARERAERESEPGQLAAIERVITGWLATIERLAGHVVGHVTSGAIDMTPPPPPRPADPDLVAAALADPRRWLDAEQTSLVLAVELAAELGLAELAVGLAAVLCASGYALNRVEDLWHRVHQAALAAARQAGNAYGEAVLVAALGQLRYEQDRFAVSRRHLWEAVTMFRALGDARGEAASLVALGMACRDQGYLPEAQHFLNQAGAPIRALDDDQALGHWQRILGSVHLEQGHYPQADAALDTALAAYERTGNGRGMALTLRFIGLAARARGRLGESDQALTRALVISRDLGDPTLEAFCLRALAKTHLRMGRLEDAYEPLETTLAASRARRDRWAEAMTLRTLGELELAAGRLDHADRYLTEALTIFQTQDASLFVARTLRDMACLREAQGEHAQAQLVRKEAVEIFESFGAREFEELTA